MKVAAARLATTAKEPLNAEIQSNVKADCRGALATDTIEKPFREMLMGRRGYYVPSTGAGLLDPSWKAALVDAFLLSGIILYVVL